MRRSEFLILLAFVLLIHLPFLSQAFHIDDPQFVYGGRHVSTNPSQPLSYPINWYGKEGPAIDVLVNPPLFLYYLAAIIRFWGESEVALHISIIPFSLIATLSMYFLSRRFIKNALYSTLFLATCPAFQVMSHTVMLDIPALALFLLSVSMFIYGCDTNKKTLIISACVLAGIGCLVKFMVLIFIPIALCYVFTKERSPKSSLFYLPITVLILSLYFLYTFISYGRVPFSDANLGRLTFSSPLQYLPYKVLRAIIYIGSVTIFPLSIIFAVLKFCSTNRLSILLITFMVLALGLSYVQGPYSYDYSLQLIFFALCGVYFLFLILNWAVNSKKGLRDNAFLLCGLSVGSFSIIFAFVSAVRYALFGIPFLLILFFRFLEDKNLSGKFIRSFCIVTVILTFVLGCVISYADFIYANVYRAYADVLYNDYAKRGRTVYFNGHWGFQYYMERLGFKMLPMDDVTSPRKGDIVIMPLVVHKHRLPEEFLKRLVLEDCLNVYGALPIHTQNFYCLTGFYGGSFRDKVLLPYSILRIPLLEQFYVFRVAI